MINTKDGIDILTGLAKVGSYRAFKSYPSPRVIAYTVTWRCNASCDMCGIKNVPKELKDAGLELTASDIDRIFKDPLLKRLDLIRFTGGEPFLKEDFPDIVDNIIRNTKTKIFYVTTNGFYSDRIVEFVRRIAPKTPNLVLQISLDAVGGLQDRLRNIPGLYDRIVCSLKGLKLLKDKYRFTYGVNQTITTETVKYVDEIAVLCRQYGCDHKTYMAHEVHESDILDGGKMSAKLALISNPGRKEAEALYDRIERYQMERDRDDKRFFSPRQLWRAVERRVMLGSRNRLLHDRMSPNPMCLAMFFYLRLLPDGTIMPCTLKPKPVGNIKNRAFSEVWRSSEARDARHDIKACKGCWVECDITPNIAYSLDTVKEICRELLFPGR